MPAPPSGLAPDARLRHEVAALLRGGNAHVPTADALDGIPFARVNERADGLPYSLWELTEHLRIAQADLLLFLRDPGYEAPPWPAAYWPTHDASEADWDATRAAVLADLDALVALALDPTQDLSVELPHAPGYTPLRELLLAADHNAYHTGQIVVLRRRLGLWPP